VRIEMMRTAGTILVLVWVASASALSGAEAPLRVVSSIDLKKYAGKWYEIARLPTGVDANCASDVVFHYAARPDGRMNVIHQCKRADGSVAQARGILRKAGTKKNDAVLQVRFAPAILSFMPNVWRDYWIIGIGPDYTWAVVGGPSRQSLWVLSRTPVMSDSSFEQAIEIAKGNGFDTSGLVKTAHPPR
jgi:apolipoprotein D and lipocalin family protein